MTYDKIVDDYIRDVRPYAKSELQYFRRAANLQEAIARSTEKRSSHQYRIPLMLLENAKIRLNGAHGAIRQARDFDELYQVTEKLIGNMRGIGELTVYDIAHRIAAFLGFEPNLVYLHRGTRVGAKALGFDGKTIDPKELPAPFSRLTPTEIEDCLCIYKETLAKASLPIGVPHSVRCCGPAHRQRMRRC